MYVLHKLVHKLHAKLHNGEDEMVTLVAKYRGLRKLAEDVLIAMQSARTL